MEFVKKKCSLVHFSNRGALGVMTSEGRKSFGLWAAFISLQIVVYMRHLL